MEEKASFFFLFNLFNRKIHYDDDDYVALNVADELEEEETLSGPEKVDEPQGRYHRPRRKRKRKRRKVEPVVSPEEELVDPEELPPRARWTIVATACLLLAMSLLLVGVTLRMAPIIDDMGKWSHESTFSSSECRNMFILFAYFIIFFTFYATFANKYIST